MNKTRLRGPLFVRVAGEGLAPPTSRLCIPLRFSSLRQLTDLWSGLYLHPYSRFESWGLPSSLYTFPSTMLGTWLGIITPISRKTSPNLTEIPHIVTNVRAHVSLASYYCSTPLCLTDSHVDHQLRRIVPAEAEVSKCGQARIGITTS